MTPRLIALLPLLLAPLAAMAAPADDLAQSIAAATGLPDDAALLEAARADLAKADPEWVEAYLPILVAMGRLAADAEHPATREVMRDLHRQLVQNMVADPATSPSLALLDASNPLLAEIVLGAGLAQSDRAAAAYLGALADSLPEDPTAAPLDEAAVRADAERIEAAFAAEVPINQQFLARLDAWLAGLLAAWPDLSEEERLAASAVASEPAIPSEALVQKVTGSADLLGWLGALDLALTDAEREAEAELMAFLAEGHMTAGATEAIVARLAAGQMGSAGLGGLTAMMELNQELLWSDLSGPSIAGDLMGLE